MDDMEHTVSDRGFIHMEPVEGTDNASVRVYESSAAASFWPRMLPGGGVEQGAEYGPCLWVRITQRDPDKPSQEMAAHLPLEAARLLRDQMTFLLRRNGQGEPPVFNPAHVEAAVRLACETEYRTEEEQRALMELAGDLGGSVIDLVGDTWRPDVDHAPPLAASDGGRRGD